MLIRGGRLIAATIEALFAACLFYVRFRMTNRIFSKCLLVLFLVVYRRYISLADLVQ